MFDGRSQMIGLHLSGEWFGMDCIDDGEHRLEATAIQTSVVCLIPMKKLLSLSTFAKTLQKYINGI